LGFFAHERRRSIARYLALAGFIIIALNWPREQLKFSFLQAVHEASDNKIRAKFLKLAEESVPSTVGWTTAIPAVQRLLPTVDC
jgi:hypothetical protein